MICFWHVSIHSLKYRAILTFFFLNNAFGPQYWLKWAMVIVAILHNSNGLKLYTNEKLTQIFTFVFFFIPPLVLKVWRNKLSIFLGISFSAFVLPYVNKFVKTCPCDVHIKHIRFVRVISLNIVQFGGCLKMPKSSEFPLAFECFY